MPTLALTEQVTLRILIHTIGERLIAVTPALAEPRLFASITPTPNPAA